MSFDNKVVLVTGASSGIGAAIAIKFMKQKAKVVIVGRNETKLANVSKKCEDNGSKPLVIKADVSKDDDARRIIKTTIENFGKLDVLVNNAGIVNKRSILDDDVMQVFDQVLATNLRAAVYLTHLAAPYLIESKGNIINISSINSMNTSRVGGFIYATSKAGMDHFTRCVALELAPKGVRVNTVNPGLTRTDIFENSGQFNRDEAEKFLEEAKHNNPIKGIIESDEVADLVCYLAGDKAKSITGGSYVIDSGRLLK